MKKLSLPIILLAFFALFVYPQHLLAQFNFGVTGLTEHKITFRQWHVTSKRGTDNFLLRQAGNTLRADNHDINLESTFFMDAGSDDANWTTPDKRWFVIRGESTGKCITVASGSGSPRSVSLEDYSETSHAQQFRLIGVGPYRLRSRLSATGTDLVLYVDENGDLAARTATGGEAENFAFNLAIPTGGTGPSQRYVVINAEQGRYLSDNGILQNETPAVQNQEVDESAYWHFIDAGNDYFYLRNTLTRQYLTAPADQQETRDVIMTSITQGDRSRWKFLREGAYFKIANKYEWSGTEPRLSSENQQEGEPALVVPGAALNKSDQWILYQLPSEPEPQTGNFQRIETAAFPSQCMIEYGPGFQRALCERVGLDAEQFATFFPFIVEAIAARVGESRVEEILEKFEFNNVGHRVDLQLMVRNYLTEVLPGIPTAQWSASALAAANYYSDAVRALRLNYANRLQQAWSDYVQEQGSNLSMFDLFFFWLDGDGFVWPSLYNPSSSQEEYIKQYVTAAATFGERNTQLLGQTFIGASMALGIVYFNAPLGMTLVKLGERIVAFFKPVVLKEVIITTRFPLGPFLATAGPVITVAVTAASMLALQIEEVEEINNLTDKIDEELVFATQAVSAADIMNGNNLLSQVKFLSDLDYLLGVAASGGYANNNDDRFLVAPFELPCNSVITLPLNESGQAALTGAAIPEPLVVCGGEIHYGFIPSQFTCANIGTPVVASMTGNNGRLVQTCNITVNVVDYTPPVIFCTGYKTIYLDANGSVSFDPNSLYEGGYDNCGEPTLQTMPPLQYDCSDHNLIHLITLNAKDDVENIGACQSYVEVLDRLAPSVVCKNRTLELDASGLASISPTDVYQSGADNCGVVSLQSVSQSGFDCSHLGQNLVTLSAHDGHGNIGTCNATVTIVDATPPDITCPAAIERQTDPGVCYAYINFDDPVFSDNCAVASILRTSGQPSGTNFNAGTHPITWKATDVSGNTRTCQFTVTVVDNQAPGIVCPANQTLSLGASCSVELGNWVTAAATNDNCGNNLSVTQSPAANALLSGHNTVQTVTLTVTDGPNNRTCTFSVTLKDQTKPAITCPANTTLAANTDCMGTIGAYPPASLSDNCTAVPSISQSPASGTTLLGHNNTQTITLMADDGNGNSQTCAFSITLKDIGKPGIGCPANTTLSAGNNCTVLLGAYAPTSVSDNCAANPSVTQTPDPATILSGHNDLETVTLTANDGHGNQETCTFNVTLKDNTKPSMTCPTDKVLVADNNCSATLGSHSPASLVDNCTLLGNIALSQSPPANTLLEGANASQIVVLSADDGHGNTRSCSFIVTLKDNTKPAITCPADKVIFSSASCNATLGNHAALAVSDFCGAPSVMQTPSSTTVLSGHNSNQSVTLTADDGNGNTETCSFTVTLKDNRKPNITCPTAKTLDAGPDCDATLGSWSPILLSDNCTPSPAIEQNPAANTVLTGHNSIQTLTLTATDDAGNTRSCTFKVTLKDKTKPTLTCPQNQTITDTDCQAEIGSYSALALSDNCNANPALSQNPDPTTVLTGHGANQLVTLKATDAAGNEQSCSFNVTLACFGLKMPAADARENRQTDHVDLIVFPNPNSGVFSTVITPEAAGWVTYSLFDATGREVLRQRVFAEKEQPLQQNFSLGKSVLPGAYNLVVQENGKKHVGRVIVTEN